MYLECCQLKKHNAKITFKPSMQQLLALLNRQGSFKDDCIFEGVTLQAKVEKIESLTKQEMKKNCDPNPVFEKDPRMDKERTSYCVGSNNYTGENIYINNMTPRTHALICEVV